MALNKIFCKDVQFPLYCRNSAWFRLIARGYLGVCGFRWVGSYDFSSFDPYGRVRDDKSIEIFLDEDGFLGVTQFLNPWETLYIPGNYLKVWDLKWGGYNENAVSEIKFLTSKEYLSKVCPDKYIVISCDNENELCGLLDILLNKLDLELCNYYNEFSGSRFNIIIDEKGVDICELPEEVQGESVDISGSKSYNQILISCGAKDEMLESKTSITKEEIGALLRN